MYNEGEGRIELGESWDRTKPEGESAKAIDSVGRTSSRDSNCEARTL